MINASTNTKQPIQVIERMMLLLQTLAESSEPLTLKNLAQKTGLHPSTAHRILAASVASKLIEKPNKNTYQLGIRFLELGQLVKSRLDIRRIAASHMQTLHLLTGEAINLAIRHSDDITYIERTSSGRSLVRVVYLVGERAPLHLTAIGKLFLAEASRAEVSAYAKRSGLPAKTKASLTTLTALTQDLASIRRHGIAYDNEEAEAGLKCVAAPIRNDEGHLLAGLSISAPVDRHKAEWADWVKNSANTIATALGYRASTTR